MTRVKSYFILAGTLLVAGCATQGGPAAPAAAPIAAAAPAAAAATQVQSAQASAAAQSAADDPDKRDPAVTRGYERVVTNGHEMYCQREAQTGMRIMQKVCMSYDQLRAEQEHAKQLTTDINRAQTNGRPSECRTMGSTAPC